MIFWTFWTSQNWKRRCRPDYRISEGAFLAYAKTIAKVSNVVVGISIAAYVLEAILIGLQRNGKTALEVTYTYRYDLLYGDPTTVPRWQATGFSYRFV